MNQLQILNNKWVSRKRASNIKETNELLGKNILNIEEKMKFFKIKRNMRQLKKRRLLITLQ